MEKLFVNKEACIGCGACIAIDSEHFDFGDDGLSEVINNDNIHTDDVNNAIASCPTNAISYQTDEHTCDCPDCNCTDCDCEEGNCQCNKE